MIGELLLDVYMHTSYWLSGHVSCKYFGIEVATDRFSHIQDQKSIRAIYYDNLGFFPLKITSKLCQGNFVVGGQMLTEKFFDRN